MSKYIIDVGDAYTKHICGKGDMLCLPVRINEFEDNWLNTNIPLTPYTEPDIEKVREEAYRQGYDTGYGTKVNEFYEQGLVDAWAIARKIIRMPEGDLLNIFTECYCAVCTALQVLLKYDAAEAIDKLKSYEQEQQIQVGDEVRNIKNGWIAVVCNIDGECMTLMDTNGALGDGYDVNRFTKTGRHFPEIAAVLAKMKEES
jgi:hypothetical protein